QRYYTTATGRTKIASTSALFALQRWMIATLPIVVLYFSEALIFMQLPFSLRGLISMNDCIRGTEEEEKRMIDENEKLVRAFMKPQFQDIVRHCELSKRHTSYTIYRRGCPSDAVISRDSMTC